MKQAGRPNAESLPGSQPRGGAIPTHPTTPSLDQARLLPRYRQPTLTINHTEPVTTFNAPGTPKPRTNTNIMVDPLELRGIPTLAPGVQGATPGSRPDHAITNLDRKRRTT